MDVYIYIYMNFPSIPVGGSYLTNDLILDKLQFLFSSRGNFNVKFNASSRINSVRLCCILKN